MKLLEKRGWLIKDETDQEFLSIESHEAIESIHGSSITYRIAFGKYRGQRALTLQTVPRVSPDNKFLAKASGFSFHAGVACKSDEQKKRERICRYISRPSLSEDRLSLNARGQVVYKLKKAYDNGTSHIILDPLDFLSRLASLVPTCQFNQIFWSVGPSL